MQPCSNYEPKFNVPLRGKPLTKISLIFVGFLLIFTPRTNAISRIRSDSKESSPYSTKVPSMDHETSSKSPSNLKNNSTKKPDSSHPEIDVRIKLEATQKSTADLKFVASTFNNSSTNQLPTTSPDMKNMQTTTKVMAKFKSIVAVTAPKNEPDRNYAGITSTSFTYRNKSIKLSPPSSGENYVKFTYNIINNTYSQTHEDGSKIDSFYFFNIERVEDRSLSQVYLRKINTLLMGSITWRFKWEVAGRAIEKTVIKMTGIEEYLKYVDGGNANACLTFSAARTRNCSIVPTNRSLTIERPEYDSLVIQLDMFRDIKLLKADLNGTINVESFSVEVYWR